MYISARINLIEHLYSDQIIALSLLAFRSIRSGFQIVVVKLSVFLELALGTGRDFAQP